MEENKDLNTAENEEEAVGLQEQTQDEQTQKETTHKSMLSTKNGLYLRTVIGGLILYYAYTIVAEITSTPADKRMPLYIFAAVFGIAGIWIVIGSLKRIFKKEYED